MPYLKLIEDTLESRACVQAWLDRDEFHQSQGVTVDMLFEAGTRAYFVMEAGKPVMAIRCWDALRFGIQFDPDNKVGTARVATWVVEQMEAMARERGAIEVMCQPGGKAIAFAKRLGFSDAPTLKKRV